MLFILALCWTWRYAKRKKYQKRTLFADPLHQVSASMLQQLCDDTSHTVLIENNGVAPEWGCYQFLSDSIVFNENSITSVITEFSQHWRWRSV